MFVSFGQLPPKLPLRVGAGSGLVYATLNPADKSANITLSGGNLTYTSTTGSGICRATIGKSSGKWYWEQTHTQINAANNQPKAGISQTAAGTAGLLGSQVSAYGYRGAVACFVGPSGAFTGLGLCAAQVPVTGTITSHLLDMDNGTYTVYFNGATIATTITGLTGTWYPTIGIDGNGNDGTVNFGQSAFTYSVPSGYNSGVYQ